MSDQERGDGSGRPGGRPAEQEAVRTTIVGGRPPGSGKPLGPIPRGIEVLVKKAAVDAPFRAALLAERDAAARRIGLALDPAEAMMLRAAPRAQLETIIARTKVTPSQRSAFLGRAAAVMLVALGAGAVGCQTSDEPTGADAAWPKQKQQSAEPAQPPAKEDVPQVMAGVAPDVPQQPVDQPTGGKEDTPRVMRGLVPDVPPPPPPEKTEAPKEDAPRPTAGIAADVPQPKAGETLEPTPQPPQPQPPAPPPAPTGIRPDRPGAAKGPGGPRGASAGVLGAPGDADAPTPQPATVTGIRPDRPPTTKGIQPDRPPTVPTAPTSPTTPTAPTAPVKKTIPALRVPADWTEGVLLDKITEGLRALAEKNLPGYRIMAQNTDAAREVRIQWKAKAYEVPEPGATPDAPPQTVRRMGAAEDGMILLARLQKTGPGERPRKVDHAGLWTTRENVVYVQPLGTYLNIDIDIGAKTDGKLVALFSAHRGWFQGEKVTSETYTVPQPPTAEPAPPGPKPSDAVTRGSRPDRPPPKAAEPAAPADSSPSARPDQPPAAGKGGSRPDRPGG